MKDEVYFMHCVFAEHVDEVFALIEDYGYGRGNIKVNNRQSLVPIQRSGTKVIWLCAPPSTTTPEQLNPLFTEITSWYDDEFQFPTEVRIICSDNKYLLDYLEKLAVNLWTHLTEWKQKLYLSHPKRKPYFTSLIDYYGMHPSEIPADVEKNADKECIEFPEILTNVREMKKYYSSYTLQMARRIYNKIPEAWNKHNGELVSQWGPRAIAEESSCDKDTVSRYLGAFVRAGVTKIINNGEEIPIPHRSDNKS